MYSHDKLVVVGAGILESPIGLGKSTHVGRLGKGLNKRRIILCDGVMSQIGDVGVARPTSRVDFVLIRRSFASEDGINMNFVKAIDVHLVAPAFLIQIHDLFEAVGVRKGLQKQLFGPFPLTWLTSPL